MYQPTEPAKPVRPDFLKILCILSFVACGLWILLCTLGAVFTLTMSPEMIEQVWAEIVKSTPEFEELDGVEFMHAVGMLCIYMIIANVFSLIGVIMMWRLERLGFFIYAIAELSTHFFSIDAGKAKDQSIVGTVIMVLIDLAFIFMYFTNLKYMNKKNNNTFVQSGS
jgi:hypothetical protein